MMDFLANFFNITPFDWPSVGITLLCGLLVGLERQLKGKPVGVRSAVLVVLGTYLFVKTAGAVSGAGHDVSRLIGQVVTGVGFLGAGVMLAKENIVLGVTSAATVWLLAALGVCIAVGFAGTALKLAVLVWLISLSVDLLENSHPNMLRGVHDRSKYPN